MSAAAFAAVLVCAQTSTTAGPGDGFRIPDPPPVRRAATPPAPRMAPPPAPRVSAPVKEEAPPPSDHEQVVGRIGVGWFGVSTVFVNSGTSVVAPTVGARYWFDERFGLDVGAGVAYSAGSGEQLQGQRSIEFEAPTVFGILGHVGAPIAIHSSDHYTFLVTPEVNVGYARMRTEMQMPGVPMVSTVERVDRGVRFELGARAGAEIQFGFIGVPELALEASVALTLSHQRLSTAVDGTNTIRTSGTSLQTLSVNDPWDFFRSTVAARYYF